MSNAIMITEKGLRKFFGYVAIIAAILALLLIFAPALGINVSNWEYSGWEIAFGNDYGDEASATMITYFALIIGIVFAALSNGRKLCKLSFALSIIAFTYAIFGFILIEAFANIGIRISAMTFEWGTIASIVFAVIALLSEIITLIISVKYDLM